MYPRFAVHMCDDPACSELIQKVISWMSLYGSSVVISLFGFLSYDGKKNNIKTIYVNINYLFQFKSWGSPAIILT